MLAAATLDEMIAVFLQGEIDSPRFAPAVRNHMQALQADESLVRQPDVNDGIESRIRRQILAYRGWPGTLLFSGFPTDTVWSRVVLDRSELAQVLYLNFPEWVQRSGGTRLPEKAAERLRSQAVADPAIRAACAAVAQRYSIGSSVPPLVLVSAREPQLVILEGCVRLTAAFFGGRGGPAELEVLLGRSPRMAEWAFF